jgi:hypothetical protein
MISFLMFTKQVCTDFASICPHTMRMDPEYPLQLLWGAAEPIRILLEKNR